MNIETALGKIGAEIVSQDKLSDTSRRFMIRTGKSPEHLKAWQNTITEFLLHAAELSSKGKPPWTVDVSRYYFVKNGSKVKYMWRIIVSGDVDQGVAAFSGAIVRGMGSAVELKSFPIISPTANPKSGSYRGAHPQGTGEAVIAKEFAK